MLKVAQAFHTMIEKLGLADRKAADVDRQRRVLRTKLDEHLSISEEFISGSFGRKTAIHPLHDVDLFLLLNANKHGELRNRPPSECLRLLQSIIHRSYPEKGTPRVQRRSVNIQFSSTNLGFDIVPAFAGESKDLYYIPDRDRSLWIPSNPRIHEKKCNEANERAGNKLKPLIRLAKHWNREHGAMLKSFHLEVMSYGVFSTPPKSFPEGFHELFKGFSAAVMLPCAEPAGQGEVDENLDQAMRTGISRKLMQAAKKAEQAIAANAAGDLRQAHALWRELLGSVYPETGR